MAIETPAPRPPRLLPSPMPALVGLVGFGFALVAGSAEPVVAQSYRDFTLVRNRPQPYRSLVQVRAGYSGARAESDNEATGLVGEDTIDGFLLWHSKDIAQGETWVMDMYGGTDGLYVGFKDEYFPGKNTQGRIELFGRPRNFYREGFYSGDDYLTTGQYEAQDYGVQLGLGQQLDQGLMLEIAAFYRRNDFDRNGQTRPDFIIPDDFAEFGVALTLEQNTLVLDRTLGLPRDGMLLTARVENVRNDSSRTWGFSSGYTSSLPSGFWRGDVRAELYFANGPTSTWEIFADGGYYDSEDRVYSYQADHVQGHQWVDASLGYRMTFGTSFVLKPYLQAQYTKILELDGVGSDMEFFWGGGADLSWIFHENMALVARYSYLDNPSRPPIAHDQDAYGEHMFFLGMDVSFGSGYRN